MAQTAAVGGNSGDPAPSAEPQTSSVTEARPTDGQATILVVEDQDDIRRMLATALGIDGYRVDEASDAHEGLRRLQQRHFDLIVTDYSMPGGTGAWMLHEASRLKLMTGTLALIVTAHPDVHEVDDVEVMAKPLDLDYFLTQVRRMLSLPDTGHDVDRGAEPAASAHRVELVLYVSASSPASMQARRNLERLLDRFDRSQVDFTVCDLTDNPLAGIADRVTFTPTLVKRRPAPRVWILGNLREPEIVADLLRASGVDPGVAR